MPDHTLTFPKRKHEIISGVYMFTCLANGKRYIGSSYDIYKRLGEHIGHLVRNDHGNHYLQDAWNLYGEQVFDIVILEECAPNVRNAREREIVIELAPEWNLALPNLEKDTWTVSEETRARISAAGRGRPKSEEHRAKMSEWQIGKKLSQETKDKIAAAHRGKAKQFSDEHRQRLSDARKGQVMSPEAIAKLKVTWAEKKRRKREELQGRLF